MEKPLDVLALELRDGIAIAVGWQHDLLRGGPGDWLLQYGPGDYGIVARAVFVQSYQILL